MKKYLLVFSGIHIILGIYLIFIGIKYVYVESVMRQAGLVIITGLFLFFYFLKIQKKSESGINRINILYFTYPIILVFCVVLTFSSIPNYSYKEAISIIENDVGEKTINKQDMKSSNRLYYIYTQNNTYVFNPWNGEYRVYK